METEVRITIIVQGLGHTLFRAEGLVWTSHFRISELMFYMYSMRLPRVEFWALVSGEIGVQN